VFVFKNGKVVERFVGVQSESVLAKALERHL
jgi:thioredoxin-like negative regulator of GroEL